MRPGTFFCNLGNHYVLLVPIALGPHKIAWFLIGAWNEPITGTVKKYLSKLAAHV